MAFTNVAISALRLLRKQDLPRAMYNFSPRPNSAVAVRSAAQADRQPPRGTCKAAGVHRAADRGDPRIRRAVSRTALTSLSGTTWPELSVATACDERRKALQRVQPTLGGPNIEFV